MPGTSGRALPGAGWATDEVYVVTNGGETTLLDVQVVDDPPADVVCPGGSLPPGASMTCTAHGTALPGQFHNLATVTARGEGTARVRDTDPSHYFGVEAGVDLEKMTNGEDADQSPGPELQPGAAVTWTYVVTNTGEVPLRGIQVTDEPEGAVACPAGELLPGQSMVCTATGTAGEVSYGNLGTVYAYGPEDQEVIDTDPSHYHVGEEPPPGDKGCTPGYWKNHLDSWPPTGYDPATTVTAAFPAAAAYQPAIAGATLLAALDFGGGAGVDGAAQILLRAGVAALLNASHPGVAYPRTPTQVLTAVDAALAAGERDAMLLLAAALDADNNLGCPLS